MPVYFSLMLRRYYYKNVWNYETLIKRKGTAFAFYLYASCPSASYYLVNGTLLKRKGAASASYPSAFYYLVNSPCILKKDVDNRGYF